MSGRGLLAAGNYQELLDYALDEAQKFGTQVGVEFLPNLLAAIAIYIIGKWAARVLVRLLNSVMKRAKVDETLAKFLKNIAQTLLMTFVILMVLERLGVDTLSLTAILGAAGVAIGFALQGSLSNFAAGVMLILF
ncbi:MAG: mechanosensitive ion channel family protein, partial [Planctomycetota bacterium]